MLRTVDLHGNDDSGGKWMELNFKEIFSDFNNICLGHKSEIINIKGQDFSRAQFFCLQVMNDYVQLVLLHRLLLK